MTENAYFNRWDGKVVVCSRPTAAHVLTYGSTYSNFARHLKTEPLS